MSTVVHFQYKYIRDALPSVGRRGCTSDEAQAGECVLAYGV